MNHQRWLTPSIALNVSGYGGLVKYTPFQYGAGLNDTPEASVKVFYEYEGFYQPFTRLTLGIDKVLKNGDLIGLFIGTDVLFEDVMGGGYYNNSGTQTGDLSNTGNQFNIGLNYSFTRAKKLKRAEDILIADTLTFKNAKKQFKYEKRVIPPKSIMISTKTGFFAPRCNVNKDFPFIESSSLTGGMFEL